MIRTQELDHVEGQEAPRFQCNDPKCAAEFFTSRASPIRGLEGVEADAVQKIAAAIFYELYSRQTHPPEPRAPQRISEQPEIAPPSGNAATGAQADSGESSLWVDFASLVFRAFKAAGEGPERRSLWAKIVVTVRLLAVISLRAIMSLPREERRRTLVTLWLVICWGIPLCAAVMAMAIAMSHADLRHTLDAVKMYACLVVSILLIGLGAFVRNRRSGIKAVLGSALFEIGAIGCTAWLVCFAVMSAAQSIDGALSRGLCNLLAVLFLVLAIAFRPGSGLLLGTLAYTKLLYGILWFIPFWCGMGATGLAFELALGFAPDADTARKEMYWCLGGAFGFMAGSVALFWRNAGRKVARDAARIFLFQTAVIGFLSWLIAFGVIGWSAISEKPPIVPMRELLKKSALLDLLAIVFLVVAIVFWPRRDSSRS